MSVYVIFKNGEGCSVQINPKKLSMVYSHKGKYYMMLDGNQFEINKDSYEFIDNYMKEASLKGEM